MTQATPRPRRRHRVAWTLFLAFVLMPLLEIYLLIQVGEVIGAAWTILLLIGSGVVGSWLMRREGSRAWRALSEALGSGRMPARELADGALILIGGTLMLTPGFVTDGLGVLMVLPVTRPLFRRVLAQVVARRLVVVGPGAGGRGGSGTGGFGTGGSGTGGFGTGGFAAGPDARRPGPPSSDGVVRGEVIDDD